MAKQKTSVEIVGDLLEGLYNDLKSSYKLAMVEAGVEADKITEIEETVSDYVSNHWF